MLKQSLNVSVLVLIFVLLHNHSGYAAVQSANETAGAEQGRFESERDIEAKTKAAAYKPAQQEVLEKEAAEISKPESAVTFLLKEVAVTGNESIATEELAPFYESFLNKQVHFKDLKAIAGAIKEHYRSVGFIAAYVYLPPQNVTSGKVEIAVIEGVIGQIEIKGNKWFSEALIRRMLRVTAGNVLFYDQLRASLNFLNKNRDIKARAVLKPGREAKTTDLEINVKDQWPLHLSTDVNNLGTDNTGHARWGVGLTHTNLLGLMDEVSSRFQIGRHAWAVGANYNIPVTSFKTALGFSYSRSAVDLGGSFKALNVRGHATTYGMYVTQPIWDEQHFNAGVNVGFDWKSVENTVGGAKAGVDELRILNLGLNLEENDRWGRTIFPQTFHVGFCNFLGSSDKQDNGATRAGTGGQFFIYRSSLLRYQHLPHDMVLATRGSMQLTPDSLAPSEQMHLGGAFSVRGYQESEYLADYGAYLDNEVYVPSYFFPKDWKLPYAKKTMRNQIMGVGFFDFGGGLLRRPLTGERDGRFLSGAGGGVRVELLDKVYGRFQWGAPTGSRPNDNTRGTFYFGVSAEVF